MIRLLIILLCVLPSLLFGRTFYISNGGSDAANGLTPATAWATLAKANSSTFLANDSIALDRNSVFFGSLILNRNNLTILAYGTGNKPIITGKVDLTSWTHMGGNVWRANLTNADSTLTLFTVNGVVTPFCRQPNWARYTAVSASSITVPHSGSWVGKTLIIKPNDWRQEFVEVLTDNGSGTITFRKKYDLGNGTIAGLEPTKNNFGCVLANEIGLVDSQGDLFFDYDNQFLYLYSTSMPTGVNTTGIDTLLNIGGRQNITVKNIDFRYAGFFSIFAVSTQNIMIDSCDFSYGGAQGFDCYRLSNSTIQNNTFSKFLQMAIYVRSVTASDGTQYNNVNILNNRVDSIGLWYGQGCFNNDGDFSGIYATASNNLNVKYNVISNIGDICIKWGGSNVDIGYNFGYNYNMRLADRGMTYTFASFTNDTNRRLHRNLSYNGFGDTTGTPNTIFRSNGYYQDGIPNRNITLDSCYAYNYPRSGANYNADSGIVVTNCMFIPGDSITRYANARGIGMQQQANSPLKNVNIQNNIIFTSAGTQSQIFYTVATIGQAQMQASYSAIGTINNNFYNLPTALNYGTEAGVGASPVVRYNHANWNTTFSHGANDIQLPTYSLFQCKFLYNFQSNSNSVRSIPGTWVDAYGKIYVNSITIPPYTAVLLFPTVATPVTVTIDSNSVITLPTNSTTLSGTATGGTITTYLWTEVTDTGSTITTPNNNVTTITGLSAGTHSYQLKATNSLGQSDSAIATVTVNPAASTPPVVTIDPNALEITLPTSIVNITGIATPGAGRTIVSYSWVKISGIGGTISSPTSSTTTITGLIAGDYIYSLTATDNTGATGSATVQVKVNPAPPTPPSFRARVKKG